MSKVEPAIIADGLGKAPLEREMSKIILSFF